MKKYLFLLIFMPLCSFAQRWDVGISTGVAAISDPGLPANFSKTEMAPTPAVMISLGRFISPTLRLGLDVDFVRFWRKADVLITSYNVPQGTIFSDGRYCIGQTTIMVAPSLTYNIHDFYVGGQAGYLQTTFGEYGHAETSGRIYLNFGKGFFGGLQAGYLYSINRSFSLNGELRTNYFQVKVRGRDVPDPLSGFQYQAMIGMRYLF